MDCENVASSSFRDPLQDSLLAASYVRAKSDLCLQDFDVRRTLGSGSYSTVKLVTLSNPAYKTAFALKLISKAEIVKSKHIPQLKEERRLLGLLDHPFIAAFIGSFQDESHVYFLFEFVSGGELFDLIADRGQLPPDWTRFYLAESLAALRYLHLNKVVFRDLKAENLLISKSGHIKLVDFGFAKSLGAGRAQTLCGTPEYMAPEMLLNRKDGYSYGVDYWALGVLGFELATGWANQRDSLL